MIAFFTEHSFLFAQILGFCAIFTMMLTYQFKKHKTIMLLLVACSLLWCFHFTILGKPTAVALNAINLIRCVIYSFKSKKNWNGKLIPIIFIVVSVISTVLTWENAWSILPLVGGVFTTCANWQSDTKRLKLLTLPVCGCWFTYNTVNSSYAGMINESIAVISILVYLIRTRKTTKKESGDALCQENTPV
ncbi:MAG TPA: hypothetical protein DDY98_02360 [Ruminococcaceae bacterium]|nr:hypothetical protein [Oscillospiraceae bacterium]